MELDTLADARASAPPHRPDVEALCTLLADLVERNIGRRPVIVGRWTNAARLLIDRDGREIEEIEAVMRWATADEFWRANILSMPKFREKYDTLKLQAARGERRGGSNVGAHLAVVEALAATAEPTERDDPWMR